MISVQVEPVSYQRHLYATIGRPLPHEPKEEAAMDERHLVNELMKAVAEEAREFAVRPHFPG